MLDIGGWEFLAIAFVLIMVVGPKELPKLLRSFTTLTRQIRKISREFSDSMHDMANEAEIAEIKKAMAKVKSGEFDDLANTIAPEGEIGDTVKEIGSAVKGAVKEDGVAEEIKSIGGIAGDVGASISADAEGHVDKGQVDKGQVDKDTTLSAPKTKKSASRKAGPKKAGPKKAGPKKASAKKSAGKKS
ncbi:hypothetical protein N9E91_00075 [Alphaproteobacteria bacterium]|jgi:sec-independent protein translocase protein TatB|nr:hypothetical protein [Alphaproteobacteria bacterium]